MYSFKIKEIWEKVLLIKINKDSTNNLNSKLIDKKKIYSHIQIIFLYLIYP